MTIIEDTRNQVGKHNLKNEYFKEQGISVIRNKLPYGDYAVCPSISVDTKKDVYELLYDIDTDHRRFKAECVNAKEHGCQLYVLVENTDGIIDLLSLSEWTEPDFHFDMRLYKSGNPRTRRYEGLRLARACETMSTRYGVQFLFCTPEESGQRIIELLEGVHE